MSRNANKAALAACVLALVGLFSVAACTSPAEPGDTISEVTHTYQGATLHCVVTNRNSNNATMSCDFVRWHAENDEVK